VPAKTFPVKVYGLGDINQRARLGMVCPAEILLVVNPLRIFSHVAGKIQTVAIHEDDFHGSRIVCSLPEMEASHLAEGFSL